MSDPLLTNIRNKNVPPSNTTTLSFLKWAFLDPSTSQTIYSQKLEHKPLSLTPTTGDARSRRQLIRQQFLHKKRKPKPLSAKEKRQLRIYDIPKDEAKYPFQRDPN
jgi:ribonuclease P protein subunit POP4